MRQEGTDNSYFSWMRSVTTGRSAVPLLIWQLIKVIQASYLHEKHQNWKHKWKCCHSEAAILSPFTLRIIIILFYRPMRKKFNISHQNLLFLFHLASVFFLLWVGIVLSHIPRSIINFSLALNEYTTWSLSENLCTWSSSYATITRGICSI